MYVLQTQLDDHSVDVTRCRCIARVERRDVATAGRRAGRTENRKQEEQGEGRESGARESGSGVGGTGDTDKSKAKAKAKAKVTSASVQA